MQIKKIEINNFRLLKSFVLDLEDNLSLIIGKNNTGKTSVLTILDKFLSSSDKKRISIDDFSIDLQKDLVELLHGTKAISDENDYVPMGISLKIFIEYDEADDLSQVNKLIMSLDPDDRHIVLSYEYKLGYSQLVDMFRDYQADKEKYDEEPLTFLRECQFNYFGKLQLKSLLHSDERVFTDLVKEGINLKDVLAFKFISAKRNVTNKDNDKTLSSQTSRIYQRSSNTTDQEATVDNFKKTLRHTDKELSGIYKDLFSSVLEKVSKFGGLKPDDTDLKISSTLQHRELLEGNTTVLYSQGDHDLPEHYNGLGYMNLISMIFEIEILMSELRRSLSEKPATLNLLFIEEPEAHTHPQMQYIFINNIKSLLSESRKRADQITIHLQTVVSTHSSHIVSECYFDDVKYLKKDPTNNCVVSKNLKALQAEYISSDPEEDARYKQYFKFLKQYLTLNRAEIFFADKAILIEGDTERVLLPAMMKKIDQEADGGEDSPLLSQNISIIEVGAHSQTFEKFIDFIGVKTLIITDIDSYFDKPLFEDDGTTPKKYDNGTEKTETTHCPPSSKSAKKTSSSSLLFFHGKNADDLNYFVNLPLKEKTLAKGQDGWKPEENGPLLICYQTSEEGYHARSFEDAFFHINKDLLGTDASAFPSLTKKWFDKYTSDNPEISVFKFSEKAVGSKPSLAIEVLLKSETTAEVEFANWKVPQYIQEGLKWIRKN